ncbi:MAG TPA: adenine nucleotide alpha hydrolase [Candidatus Desulfobacillus sp.]|nr:adenine nucleotide alpha hydrolase [Candidatus Desulfobacillus sp.]
MNSALAEPAQRLAEVLRRHRALAIAVSGGVDSLTLAAVAQRAMTVAPLMVHAVSPAVPPAATERVRRVAADLGWSLREIAAGEFSDPNYLANPYDRCYHCKSNLYDAMARITDRVIASGTNADDLGDYRPGLRAASEREVVHPFVEAGIDKAQIRAMARRLGLEFAELPAQPCLASRVETGVPIRVPDLGFIDDLEGALRARLGELAVVRVRMRADGVHVELGELPPPPVLAELEDSVRGFCSRRGYPFRAVRPYRQGSAFVKAP